MKQIILLFAFLKMHLKLCILLFLAKCDQFTDYVLKKFGKKNYFLAFLGDFVEHVLKTDHIEWNFFKRESHYF